MSGQKEAQKNTCPTNQENEEDNHSSASLRFDLLTIHDRKSSQESELQSLFKETESYDCDWRQDSGKRESGKKSKAIQKREREGEAEKKQTVTKKRRISDLEKKIEKLQLEIASLRRNEDYCQCCRGRLPEYYRERLEVQDESAPNEAGQAEAKKNSKDSLEFEKVDFHSALIQSQEMQQKMWIFVGTMLIAMGSKVTDFDGTINIFKVLKQSVDSLRKQVEKCQQKIGMEFYCCKEEMHQPQNFIDGMIFDPFYSQKHEASLGHFSLDGIKLESVEEYELFYDQKYHFNIKYDALLTIMEFARDNCSIS